MRRTLVLVILTVTTFGPSRNVKADEPEVAFQPRTVAQGELIQLGHEVARVDTYRDNFYQYEARVEQLAETAIAMEGNEVEVLLRVRRVTANEVLVETIDAGRTRMILKHATPPSFGNLGTIWYCAQPSSDYWNMLAKPIGLRIGDEISLDIAKELRQRDVLRVVGRIEKMPIRMKHVFEPQVAAVVIDWKVTEVIKDSDRNRLGY